MSATLSYRETADFFLLAMETCCRSSPLVPRESVIRWIDNIVASTTVPQKWMLDLSISKNLDDILSILRKVPGKSQPFVATSVFIAYLHRLWVHYKIECDRMCYVLFDCADYVGPEHQNAAANPDSVLSYCVTSDLAAAETQVEVDTAIEEFCQNFTAFRHLIPKEV